MSQDNLISASISDADKTAVIASINDIKTKLASVITVSLTPDERKGGVKLGDKNLAFTQKAIAYGMQNPNLVPAFLDIAEANKDLELTQSLSALLQQLNTLVTSMDDALFVAGGEAYSAALIFYTAVKSAVRSNVPGSQAIADDLSTQFPGRTGKSATTQVAIK